MSWLWQPLLAAGAQLLSTPPPVDVTRGVRGGDSGWTWQPLGGMAKLILTIPPADVFRGVRIGDSGWTWQPLGAIVKLLSVEPARGPAVAAVLLVDPNVGSSVTYSWATNVLPARDGTEQRIALRSCPRESYEFSTLLSSSQAAQLQSALFLGAPGGNAFGVPLMHESLLVTLTTTANVITVTTTALSDWCEIGQRVLVLAPNGSDTAIGVIQSFTATTIRLDVAVGAAGKRGARIMPVMPCYLEDTQGFGLYPVNAGTYELKARAVYFGNKTGAWTAVGATVTTYTDPVTSVVHPVFDRGLVNEDTTPRALQFGTEISDRGGLLLMTARQDNPDVAREIRVRCHTDADRQWLKKFQGTVFGCQRTFLLPTWDPDLVPLSDASTGVLTVVGPPAASQDYASIWAQSGAHQHLQLLKTDGTVAYRTVMDAANNGDGTSDILLDTALSGALARVSFLELCRFDSDDIVVRYETAGVGDAVIPARVVQQ